VIIAEFSLDQFDHLRGERIQIEQRRCALSDDARDFEMQGAATRLRVSHR